MKRAQRALSRVTNGNNAKRSRSEAAMAAPAIILTEHETQLFKLLREAVQYTERRTVLRVAGGWVRDKLLGRNSDDIDLALDNLSGVAFAECVNKHMAKLSMETHQIGVIQANPDQSKHLETAKVWIMGQWVDFAHLRTETYRINSRIPEVAFGTAEEDAQRRDFTINAMFYNLNTFQLEDLTGHGLADLLGPHPVIRTPLAAHATFLDDPLRLLRAVRFAARFNLPLHDDIRAAASMADLQHALVVKVSRERVGIEVEGMVSGKDARPAIAFDLLVSLGLAEALLFIPEHQGGRIDGEIQEAPRWWVTGRHMVQMVNLLLMSREGVEFRQQSLADLMSHEAYQRPRRDQRRLFLAGFLRAWAGRETLDRKNKYVPVIQVLAREAMKLKNRDVDDLCLLFKHLQSLLNMSAEAQLPSKRVEVGLLLRELKELWTVGLDLACTQSMAAIEGTDSWGNEAVRVMEHYRQVRQTIEEMDLGKCWTCKPLMDGKTIITKLGVPKGPKVGEVMTEQMKWQLKNPHGSIDELTEHLRSFVAHLPEMTTTKGTALNSQGKAC